MKKLLLTLSFIAGVAAANAQIYYSQDFEGGVLPTGWNQVTSATDGGWKFGTNTQVQSSNFPIPAHTKMACTNDDACNCNKSNDLLYTSSIDLSLASNVFMSYDCYYFNLTYQGITEQAKIVVSIDAGTTWTDLMTVPGNSGSGWQTNNVNLSAYVGNSDVRIGFRYNDGGGWLYAWAIDNLSIFSPPAGVDLMAVSAVAGKMDPTPAFVGFTKYISSLPLEVRITVRNEALTPITSFDVSWTDGTNTYNQSVSGVTINTLDSYTFTATDPYTTLSGNQTITLTLSNINGGATELSTTNNIATQSIEGVIPHPDRKYFAEEGTGTWCGWCPRGSVFMDYMRETYPDQFVGVAVHNGDQMTVTAYDAGLALAAFPGVKIYRQAVIDPSELESDLINKIAAAPLVVITGTAVLNTTTNVLTVDLTGTFTQNLNGDYRFAAILKEDSVHNNSYGQTNYYAGGGNGPMGGYELLAGTVPGSTMYYDFVGRTLLGTFGGQTGSIPATITSGTPYSYQLTTTVPATFVQSYLSVAAIVLQASNGQALNALNIPITFTTGVTEVAQNLEFSVYPNPVTDKINLDLNFENAQNITISINDALGKEYLQGYNGKINAGSHHMELDARLLASGVYFVNIQTEEGKLVRKFTK